MECTDVGVSILGPDELNLENSIPGHIFKNLDLMDAHVDDGMDPIEMAKSIYKIINTKKPKLHYKVGNFMQKFSIALKRILPDRIYERLLMNHYKL